MTEPPFDLQRAHRWFGVEFNNVAWDLVEKEDRTADEAERMIHAAHASCLHWLQVGSPVNHQRAHCLLATVYAAAGLFDMAARYAERCLSLSSENGETQTAFDLATAFGCAARAYAGVRRTEAAREHYQQALRAAEKFEDAEDRQVFDRLYPAP